MRDIVERLDEPEAHYPGNFDTPKRANAMLSCLCQEAKGEIESLRQQLSDAQREAAHWKNNHETEVRRARILKERTDMPIERVQAYEKWGEDQQQLAASQARGMRLREALNTAADKFHDYAEYHSMKERTRDNIEKVERNLSLAKMCDEALALPQDTSALEALIAKAGEVMREQCVAEVDWILAEGGKTQGDKLRAMPGVTMGDLQ